MRDYRHMMEQVTLSDEKKEEIMGMIENKDTGKRRMPKVGTMVLAAALAVGCIAMMAAGLPAQVYHFISGGSITINPGTDTAYYDRLDVVDPVEVDENGRVWLTADGQHLDITDQVDENTPYLYERTDGETGQKGYLLIGGDHDNLGWMEWYQMDGYWFWHAENCLNDSPFSALGAVGGPEGSVVVTVPDDVTPEVGDPAPMASGDVGYITGTEYTVDDTEPYQIDYRPWVEAGIDQLAEMGITAYEPQVD